MEIEANNLLTENLERLNAATSLLERTVTVLEHSEASTANVQKIVAAIEPGADSSFFDIERRLAQLEAQVHQLNGSALQNAGLHAQEGRTSVRKTLPAGTAQLLVKQGITSVESIEASALDAALTGLSLEQRIAVKAQLLRAGVMA